MIDSVPGQFRTIGRDEDVRLHGNLLLWRSHQPIHSGTSTFVNGPVNGVSCRVWASATFWPEPTALIVRASGRASVKAGRRRSNRPGNSQAPGPLADRHSGKRSGSSRRWCKLRRSPFVRGETLRPMTEGAPCNRHGKPPMEATITIFPSLTSAGPPPRGLRLPLPLRPDHASCPPRPCGRQPQDLQ